MKPVVTNTHGRENNDGALEGMLGMRNGQSTEQISDPPTINHI
jgi:hypothetical protein